MRIRFWNALALAGALLFLAGGARAQTQTNVTATIKDPLGIPYSNGTYSIQLIPTGTNPSVNGQSIGGAFNGSTDANGSFNVSLWPNASIVPGGTRWQFTVCTNPGGVAPPLGTGNQCTQPTVVTIAGVSQSLSATLSAVAPGLTTITLGTGSVTSVSGMAPIVATPNPIVGIGTISCPTCNTSSATIAGSIAVNQVAVGSGVNTIAGSSNFTWNAGTQALSVIGTGVSRIGLDATGTVSFIGGLGADIFLPSVLLPGGISLIISPATNGIVGIGNTTATTWRYDDSTGYTSWGGSTSGRASIGVQAIAGTPNPLLLPSATAGVNTLLQSDGGSPQTLTWTAITATNCPLCVLTNQTNVYTAGLQDFSGAGVTMEIPEAAGFTTNVNSTIGLDTTANAIHVFVNNADSLNVVEAVGITVNVIPKSTDATHGLITASLATDNGTTFTYTGTSGVTAPALGCGVLNTTACVITGFGSTSGTATITWPAVAGTTTNGLSFSNVVKVADGSTSGVAYGFNSAPNTGLYYNGGSPQFSVGGANIAGFTSTMFTFSTALGTAALKIIMSATTPTIAAAGCGGAAASILANNGTAAFKIGVGTTPGSACTVTLPAATTGWNCSASDITTQTTAVSMQRQTGAESTTSVTITNFSDLTVATAFVANDVLKVTCFAD